MPTERSDPLFEEGAPLHPDEVRELLEATEGGHWGADGQWWEEPVPTRDEVLLRVHGCHREVRGRVLELDHSTVQLDSLQLFRFDEIDGVQVLP